MYSGSEQPAAAKPDSTLTWTADASAAAGYHSWLNRATGRSIAVFGTLLLIAGCVSRGGSRDDRSADDGVSIDEGAIVLTGRTLADGSGNLLAAMMGKIPNFRVIRNVSRQCPQIALRNRVNFQGYRVDPHIYVDGTRATNTCILESLRSSDVQRIEVYPQGFTKRPGYGRHADGLILVFMRSD